MGRVTLRLSTAARNAGVAAIAALADAGSGPGVVRIYTGSQPATPATSASGTLLVTIPFNDPAFGAPATGVVTADDTPAMTADAVADGTAGWFRLLDSTGAAVLDGAVPGEMTLSNTAITTGTAVTITGGTLTQPAA